jgi:hypothetical protein
LLAVSTNKTASSVKLTIFTGISGSNAPTLINEITIENNIQSIQRVWAQTNNQIFISAQKSDRPVIIKIDISSNQYITQTF